MNPVTESGTSPPWGHIRPLYGQQIPAGPPARWGLGDVAGIEDRPIEFQSLMEAARFFSQHVSAFVLRLPIGPAPMANRFEEEAATGQRGPKCPDRSVPRILLFR